MESEQRSATLYDVAREAGVSLATASRTLNGSARSVREPNRRKVLDAAERLGYTPNLSAQAVARGASEVVALVVGDLNDPYFSALASGVIRRSAELGLVATIAVTGGDSQRELALVRTLRGQRPRAIVLASSRSAGDPHRDELRAELESYVAGGGRAVLIAHHELPFPSVGLDPSGAGALAGALVDLGYRGVVLLAGPEDLIVARERVEAFLAELGRRGIAPIAVLHGGFDRTAGESAVAELDLSGVDLIWAANDIMAVGAMAGLRERGIDVGPQIGVAGYGDIPMARDVTPSLTTVHLPIERGGEVAIELAFGDDPVAEQHLASSVLLRSSTPQR